MISFNSDSVFNLKPIDLSQVRGEVTNLLIVGEEILYAFQTVRDQMVFTNKRVISIDVMGITGKRKSFATLPYSKIQFFEVRTPGFAEIIPDAEMMMTFASGFTARFEFRGNVDIGNLARLISEYVL